MKPHCAVFGCLIIVGFHVEQAAAQRADLWFDGAAGNPAATVASEGIGQSLNLECDLTTSLRCAWLVTMKVKTDTPGDEVGLLSWSQDLVTSGTSELVTNVQFADGGEFEFPFAGIVNTGSALLLDWTAISADMVPPGEYDLLQFILQGAYLPGNAGQTVGIASPIGGSSWDGTTPFDLYVGPNPPVQILSGEPNPAILIHLTPEPGSGMLLLLAAPLLGLRCRLRRNQTFQHFN